MNIKVGSSATATVIFFLQVFRFRWKHFIVLLRIVRIMFLFYLYLSLPVKQFAGKCTKFCSKIEFYFSYITESRTPDHKPCCKVFENSFGDEIKVQSWNKK